MLPQLKTALLDLLFPLQCLECGREGSLICSTCSQTLPRMEPPFCHSCGITTNDGILCPVCRRFPLTVDGIRSPFLFEGLVREAIHQLKYKRLKTMAAPLGQLLAEYINTNSLPADALIPVPLHPKRTRERGYNQALLLAREISKKSHIPIIDDMLIRQKNTASQARTTSAIERRNNVQDAFAYREKLDGRKILLIDDVCTTGATIDACAVVLKEAGADEVWGLTISRDVLAPKELVKRELAESSLSI